LELTDAREGKKEPVLAFAGFFKFTKNRKKSIATTANISFNFVILSEHHRDYHVKTRKVCW
jgi:hypothetical protein